MPTCYIWEGIRVMMVGKASDKRTAGEFGKQTGSNRTGKESKASLQQMLTSHPCPLRVFREQYSCLHLMKLFRGIQTDVAILIE